MDNSYNTPSRDMYLRTPPPSAVVTYVRISTRHITRRGVIIDL